MHSKIFAVLGEVLEGLESSLSPAGQHNQEPRRGSDVVNGKVAKKWKKKKETIFYNFISFGRWVSKVHQTSKSRLYLVCCSMLKLSNAVTLYNEILFFQLIYWEEISTSTCSQMRKTGKDFFTLKMF